MTDQWRAAKRRRCSLTGKTNNNQPQKHWRGGAPNEEPFRFLSNKNQAGRQHHKSYGLNHRMQESPARFARKIIEATELPVNWWNTGTNCSREN